MAPSAPTPAAPTWGEVAPDELGRILVVSPHLDDAAMGAAHLIGTHHEVTVVTVFTGRPPRYPDPPADWDAQAGFGPADDVMAARREEDRSAMALLGATPVWLGFVEGKYLAAGQEATPEEVAVALEGAIDSYRPTAVFVPMGLANPEHVVTHAAAALVREQRSQLSWFAYTDAGYMHLPGMLAWRISSLFRSGLWPTPAMVPVEPDAARKRRAVQSYTSQLAPLTSEHALRDRLDANVGEQYWRLAPPPPGWERMAEHPAP